MALCRHELVLTGRVYDFYCTALPDYARSAEILLSLFSLPYTEVRCPPTPPTHRGYGSCAEQDRRHHSTRSYPHSANFALCAAEV